MKNLSKITAKWQKVLRLRDWEIDINFYRARDFSNLDALGECVFNINSKEASIKILDPIDFETEYDIEEVVVHELLHLHFAQWTAANNYECPISAEQGIDAIAQALTKLEKKR